jgi:hypothetical protein
MAGFMVWSAPGIGETVMAREKHTPLAPEPVSYSVTGASQSSGLGIRHIRTAVNEGKLKAHRIGGRK